MLLHCIFEELQAALGRFREAALEELALIDKSKLGSAATLTRQTLL